MDTTIYVSLEGAAKTLSSTLPQLEETLRSNPEVRSVAVSALPTVEGRQQVKDLALEIFASGVAISAVLVALKGVLGPYLNTQALRLVREELVALREADGNIARDANGNPIYRVAKIEEVADLPEKSSSAVDATLGEAVHLKVTSNTGS